MDDDPAWLEEALALARRTDALFRDGADGTYWFTRTHDGFARPKLASDSALPAAQAVLLASFARLAERTGNEAWRRKAEPVRHAAGGVVRVHVKVRATGQGTSRITADMRLKPGWHVNAARPGDENLIPTRLEDINPRKPLITGVRYPEPAMRRLRFAGREMPVLEGRFRITAKGRTSGAPLRMRLTFQPCSDDDGGLLARLAEAFLFLHGLLRQVLEKELDWHAQDLRHLEQTGSRDAVCPLLVLLNLLESQAETFTELFLTHADQHATHAHAVADVHVNGIGVLFFHFLLRPLAPGLIAIISRTDEIFFFWARHTLVACPAIHITSLSCL